MRATYLNLLPNGARFRLVGMNITGILINATESRALVRVDRQPVGEAMADEAPRRAGKPHETSWAACTEVEYIGNVDLTAAPSDEPHAPRAAVEPKPKAERDQWGNRTGTQAAQINALLLSGVTDIEVLSQTLGCREARIKDHARYLGRLGVATTDGATVTLTGSTASVTPSTTQDPKPTNAAPVAAPKRPKTGKARFVVLGLNACSVLRWMGANCWDFAQAALAIEELGAIGMSDSTMKLHLAAGKRGETRWGVIPQLTASQIAKLEVASK